MEVMRSHLPDITEGGAKKNTNQSECITSQPLANETLPQNSTEEAPAPLSDRSEDGDFSDDSLTGNSTTNDVSRLLPSHHNASTPRKQKGVDTSSTSPGPICAPPPPSSSSTCNRHNGNLHQPHQQQRHPHHPHRQRHQSTNQNRLSSTKSHASFKSDAAHIKEVAGDDCCVHCVLACLFCELLSMCSALGECLACGLSGVECCGATDGCGCCCCCMEAAGEAACTEEACQAVLDCGILEDCCGSSDCLEVCLECCSICFPS